MRSTAMLLVGLVGLLGCGETGPRTYSVGEEGIVVHDDQTKQFANLGGIATADGVIPAGTKIRVSHDPGPASEFSRKLQVLCLDGPMKDRSVHVYLSNIQIK